MALTEHPTLENLQSNEYTRPSAINYHNLENGHQILSNSYSNSSTNSNTSAFSVSSNISENGCPTLPKSFFDNHQCSNKNLIKHHLLLLQQASHNNLANQNSINDSQSAIQHHHLAHSMIHHPLHHLQSTNRPLIKNELNNLHFKPLCRTQNINNFNKLSESLHKKIEYSGSSSSSSTSGCISSSTSSSHFSQSPSKGPQTPQSNYVISPLAQSSTTDSGLCLSFRSGSSTVNTPDTIKSDFFPSESSSNSLKLEQNNNNEEESSLLSQKNKNFSLNQSGKTMKNFTNKSLSNQINKNAIKKIELNKKISPLVANAKLSEQKSLLSIPSIKSKDTDDESLISSCSKNNENSSDLSTISATSTTNLINNNSNVATKTSLPGATNSFFHYPNIYNPLKNQKNNSNNSKKLIRFMTVCAYVFAVSLVAILLSLYYLFIWNPYTKSNVNMTRTYINSEILFIEKTNYYDIDVSGHPQVIGASPDSPHLTPNVKVNQTESKIVHPLASESSQKTITFDHLNPNEPNYYSNSEEMNDGNNYLPNRSKSPFALAQRNLDKSILSRKSLIEANKLI